MRRVRRLRFYATVNENVPRAAASRQTMAVVSQTAQRHQRQQDNSRDSHRDVFAHLSTSLLTANAHSNIIISSQVSLYRDKEVTIVRFQCFVFWVSLWRKLPRTPAADSSLCAIVTYENSQYALISTSSCFTAKFIIRIRPYPLLGVLLGRSKTTKLYLQVISVSYRPIRPSLNWARLSSAD